VSGVGGHEARGQWARVALMIPALLGIFLVGQAILDRRALRIDLTPENRYTLSDHAVKILDGLPANVRVTAFLRAQDPRNPLIEDLLRQVVARTDRVQVETLDVNRSPALARQYGVDSYGALVVESDGRRRVFSNPREEVLMAALLQVTRQQRKTVGWVVGHGEGDPNSVDRRDGCSTARAVLEQEYYEVRPVSLIGDEVPVGIDVLVIAGPEKSFLPEELAVLDRYLQRPGQAFIMLDPLRAPDLAAFLHRYALDLPPDLVIDPEARLYGGEFLTMQVQIERGDHPILGPLDAPPLFSLTRSVGVLPDESGNVVALPFLRTSPTSWATTDTAVLRTGSPAFMTGRDRRGPVTVGLEVAFRTLTSPGAPPAQGRMIVYGNSKFAGNFFIEYLGNKDLFVNTINWLAREPASISHRPRRQELGLQQFYVSAEQGNAIFWGTAVLEPAVFGLIGLVLVVRRRRG
jgi:gliding motility-associatede transport system auxiliary component